jgi:hypothetical protein
MPQPIVETDNARLARALSCLGYAAFHCALKSATSVA